MINTICIYLKSLLLIYCTLHSYAVIINACLFNKGKLMKLLFILNFNTFFNIYVLNKQM